MKIVECVPNISEGRNPDVYNAVVAAAAAVELVHMATLVHDDLLDAIDRLGIRGDTLFIFTADNGPEALEAGGTSLTVETAIHGSAGPWRGTLFTGFEGALRVPFVVRWPGGVAAGTSSDEIVHAMDLFPTLATIAGGEVPADRIIDGDLAVYGAAGKVTSARFVTGQLLRSPPLRGRAAAASPSLLDSLHQAGNQGAGGVKIVYLGDDATPPSAPTQ